MSVRVTPHPAAFRIGSKEQNRSPDGIWDPAMASDFSHRGHAENQGWHLKQPMSQCWRKTGGAWCRAGGKEPSAGVGQAGPQPGRTLRERRLGAGLPRFPLNTLGDRHGAGAARV